jgi:ParB/RepB/Spo0J family partition protein
MKLLQLPPSQIVIPTKGRSPVAKKDDAILRRSIEVGGVHQPVVVIEENGRYVLVKGSRRLRAAKELKLATVPVLVDEPPEGELPERYRQRLRFILSHHRQDLRPSQKAQLIDLLKATFGLNHSQVAAYLGVDADSITNWLAVKNYIEPIAKALDHGKITMQAARIFDGLSERGQRDLWKKHRPELSASTGGRLAKTLRRQYPPEKFPAYYRDPERSQHRLAAAQARQGEPHLRRGALVEQRRNLAKRLAAKETELAGARAELQKIEKRLRASAPAILRNPKRHTALPPRLAREIENWLAS